MRIQIDNKITLKRVPADLAAALIDRLAFDNPKWIENDEHGYWNGETPKTLKFYERGPDGGLIIPRGFMGQLTDLCLRHSVAFHVDDQRRTLPDVDFQFHGQLRPFQTKAVAAVAARDFGTLSAPTGSGKTVMALWLIAQRKQPALVVCHTRELMEQWISRIETFLGIPSDQVGRFGQGKQVLGEKITVSLVQTLYKCTDEVAPHIGHLIVDEAHRMPSRTFTEAVTAFDCRYMLGLSATPWRRDKLSRLIFWHIGDTAHEVSKEELLATGDILAVDVITRKTDFQPWHDPSTEYSKMLSELTQNEERNQLIVGDVAGEAKNGSGVCLVLSDRKKHCETICEMLAGQGVDSELLTGDLNNADRQRVVNDLNAGKVKVLVATGALLGEGFDCQKLSTLFLATPIRFSGRVTQYLGRILRPGPAPGKKKARVFDYHDVNVGVLEASFRARRRVYGVTDSI